MTEQEKAAARLFRDQQRRALAAANESTPPDLTVSVFVRQYRHDCPVRGPSVALELREHYVWSPAYVVEGSVVTETLDPDVGRGIARVAGAEFAEPARFGFIFTEGRCGACGMTARSKAGRLVDPAERPPAEHAIVR